MMRTIPGVLVLLMAAGAAAAQPGEESWENLSRLRPGQKIAVVDMKMKRVEGDYMGHSGEAISLRVAGQEVAVTRADVFRVSVTGAPRRGRNALIGAAIGAAGGLAAAAIRGATYHESGETSVFMLVYTPIGTGIGAATGALLPGGAVTVYRAAAPAR